MWTFHCDKKFTKWLPPQVIAHDKKDTDIFKTSAILLQISFRLQHFLCIRIWSSSISSSANTFLVVKSIRFLAYDMWTFHCDKKFTKWLPPQVIAHDKKDTDIFKTSAILLQISFRLQHFLCIRIWSSSISSSANTFCSEINQISRL